MYKKAITGALVLVIISASNTTAYAAHRQFAQIKYRSNTEINQGLIEIISPKGDVIVQDSLLISVQVLDNASVTLKIYKQDTDDELIFGPEKVDQGENLKFYNKQIKDLSPGKYKMVFEVKDKDGNKKDPVVKYFTVKNKDEEMTKSLNNIMNTNVLKDILFNK
ncbi:hypothetical protein [Geosporobacter ferrireducens]|uniref:Uncharacterized protein n=1 Tax=Geosporobacter ferrireducens TaxID=1424294 RepID=A0A1D8GI07_9FIRM|nr:hypothetical protein [Geosporobacter ferrireducens]AOT70546.1 hypothetical protein Gferi_13775 [Geosporobacter ferrireducens]MTI57094.1 hypothetical protein [Geosporobacter ferrireducens]